MENYASELFEVFPKNISKYDVTLRDGNQTPGVTFTLEDKLEAAQKLGEFGFDCIEAGWPSSSLTDITFFKKIRGYDIVHAKIVAFGSTRKPKNKVYEDPNLELLLKSEADILTIFGKSSEEQAIKILSATPEDNLTLIGESVDYLKSHGYKTFYDAEHYFESYIKNPGYALETLKAAKNADAIILCDTNGGFVPELIEFITRETRKRIGGKVSGIHCHNDSGMANANTIAALKAGVNLIQGGFCGTGERAGNVSWDELLPTLRYKYNVKIIDDEKLRMLKPIVEYFQRITGFRIPPNKPYVGDNVFTHAGGAHTDAVLKYANSYEHINPELVGNARSFVLSDQAGSASIVAVAEKFGYILNKNAPAVKKMLDIVKSKHHFTDTQLYLLLASEVDKKPLPFELMDYETRSKMHGNSKTWVKVRINKNLHTADAEGVGPVHSFDLALRKVLSKHLTKKIEKVALTSYHVTIYREEKGTAALTEVSIGFNSNGEKGSTIGESEDILKASVPPLVEGYTYFLYRLNKK